jgi:putative mRNA 3-end processing factor
VPAPADLIAPSSRGLSCERGGFHIDPWRPVPLAVVTHAHSDHAAGGSGEYVCTPAVAEQLRLRLGAGTPTREVAFGEAIDLGRTRVTLIPAGHTLGSAQALVEDASGERWVVTGDYKRDADATTEAFEVAPCDVLLTESTFGLPIFRWPDPSAVAAELNAWWRANREAGRTSVVLAYALGKAQRVLGALDPSIGPIGAHGAVLPMCEAYRRFGVALPEVAHASEETAAALKGAGLIVAPPSAMSTTWPRKFAGLEGTRVAMASGWMAIRGRRRWRAVDRGFVLSDHADWAGLVRTVRESGARRVGVTHGYASALARWLGEHGWESFVVPTRWEGEAAPGSGAASGERDLG